MLVFDNNDKYGKESISQRFIRSTLTSILNHKLETLNYQANKKVSYDSFGIKRTG